MLDRDEAGAAGFVHDLKGKTLSEVPSSPKAARQSLPRWLDPKLILGVLFVAASMVLGSQVVLRADQSIEVWAMADSVPEGIEIVPDEHLTTKRVRFINEADAQRYLATSEDLGDGVRTVRGVGEGELLPANAVTRDEDDQLRELPVEFSHAPANLAVGDEVDVFVVPDEDGGAPEEEVPTDGEGPDPASEPVLSGVRVLDTGSGESALGGAGTSQVTVQVTLDDSFSIGQMVAAMRALSSGGTTYIVRLPSN